MDEGDSNTSANLDTLGDILSLTQNGWKPKYTILPIKTNKVYRSQPCSAQYYTLFRWKKMNLIQLRGLPLLGTGELMSLSKLTQAVENKGMLSSATDLKWYVGLSGVQLSKQFSDEVRKIPSFFSNSLNGNLDASLTVPPPLLQRLHQHQFWLS